MRNVVAALVLVGGLGVAYQFLLPAPPAPVAGATIISNATAPQLQPVAASSPAATAAVAPLPASVADSTGGAADDPALADLPEDVRACRRIWDASTHMSREEWVQSCRRVDSRSTDAAASAELSGVAGRQRPPRSNW